MVIKLPTIEGGMEIGTINPATGEIIPSDNSVTFSCRFSGDCCGNPQFGVPITDMDIERIENHGYELDQIVEELSPEIRFAQDDTAEKNYWMKRKPFTGKCTFLEDNKCSIHEVKPFACRIFPFQFRGNGDDSYRVVVHQSNICQSVAAVPAVEAENEQLLRDLLSEVQVEDRRRLDYFTKYGNQ